MPMTAHAMLCMLQKLSADGYNLARILETGRSQELAAAVSHGERFLRGVEPTPPTLPPPSAANPTWESIQHDPAQPLLSTGMVPIEFPRRKKKGP